MKWRLPKTEFSKNYFLQFSLNVRVFKFILNLSFTFGEQNLVGLDRELYVTLKFFSMCYRNTEDQEIPTYTLKDIYCAYIQGV